MGRFLYLSVVPLSFKALPPGSSSEGGLNRVIRTLAEVSAFAWSLKVLEFFFSRLDSSTILLSFLLYTFLHLSNGVRIPIANLKVDKAGGDFYEVVEWGEGFSVAKVKLGGSGLIEVYLSLAATIFLLLSLAIAVRTILRFGVCCYLEVVLLFAISTLFYHYNSNYLRNVGISVSATSALLYATIVSIYLAYSLGKDLGLSLALAVNSLSLLVGCDLLMVKYAILGSRSVTIGGLGVYDAVVLIPSLSYLVVHILT